MISQWSLRNRLLVAVLLVSAIGIGASDFVAISALRSFLIKQVDSQLTTLSSSTLMQLDRAGIAPTAQTAPATDDGGDNATFHPIKPLEGLPTTNSVTLLDSSGALLGQVGGGLTQAISSTLFAGYSEAKVAATQAKPFTVNSDETDSKIRVLALNLPSGQGSVIFTESLDRVQRTLKELNALFLFISLIVLLFVGFLARTLIGVSLKPLKAVEDTAAAIADGDLSARLPEAKPNTEVGKLTASLNTMLGRIEESFAIRIASENRLRRFAADASHELRTPLTAIRGFAELHRQGAVTGEANVKELVGRIEKESIRMGSLVEDLLLLARMDQEPNVNSEPVDLTTLVTEVVASAIAAGPHHPISVSLPDESFVLGDSMRIHQAVANLLANARTHTPDGTSIAVTITQSDTETVLAVRDNGPGLSEEDQGKIFERFFRSDSSRARTKGEGSGLGLSIVDAVMKAHGGSVSVNSTIGEGAEFALHFPIHE